VLNDVSALNDARNTSDLDLGARGRLKVKLPYLVADR